jgi:hypothetical protein
MFMLILTYVHFASIINRSMKMAMDMDTDMDTEMQMDKDTDARHEL